MANTTNFGWETPDDTDLVKDGAAAIRTLGSAIDTSLVDLKGGTTGQVLAKNSNTDMDFIWTAGGDITEVTAGTGISGGGTSGAVTITNSMATAIDAKGDLVAGTGSDAFARLAVGANGTILTADSNETTGLKWATASAGYDTLYLPEGHSVYARGLNGSTAFTVTTGRTYYTPIFLPNTTLNQMAIRTGGAHSGTSVIRLGIYNNDSTNNVPSTVLLDAGTVSATSTTTNYTITINQTITKGFYWLALNVQSATTPNLIASAAGDAGNVVPLIGTISASPEGNVAVGFYETVSAVLGFATAGSLTLSDRNPFAFVRIP